MTPQDITRIARATLATFQEHRAEHSDTYWLGYLVATLEKIAEEED